MGVVMKFVKRISVAFMALALVGGCAALGGLSDKFGNDDAHHAAREAPSLRIPPDLSRARVIESMKIPGNGPAAQWSTPPPGADGVAAAVDSGLNARLLVDGDGSAAIVLANGFEPVWAAVGAALRAMGARLVGDNPGEGWYEVAYAAASPEQDAGFFSRLAFWEDRDEASAQPQISTHRVLVRAVGRQTVVTVLTLADEPDRSAAAQQLLAGIEARLRLI